MVNSLRRRLQRDRSPRAAEDAARRGSTRRYLAAQRIGSAPRRACVHAQANKASTSAKKAL